MKITGAVFDLDGTLLNSMGIWVTAGEVYLKSKGITPTENISEITASMSLMDAARYVRENYGITDKEEQIISDIVTVVKDFYFNTVEVKKGVPEFLENLKQMGVRMCIATAADRILIKAALERNGVFSYFDKVFTCNEIGKGKDSPDIYCAAHRFLNTEKEYTWVFEDALHGAITAKEAGFKLCGVFDESEANPHKLKEISDVYLESFEKANKYFQ